MLTTTVFGVEVATVGRSFKVNHFQYQLGVLYTLSEEAQKLSGAVSKDLTFAIVHFCRFGYKIVPSA